MLFTLMMLAGMRATTLKNDFLQVKIRNASSSFSCFVTDILSSSSFLRTLEKHWTSEEQWIFEVKRRFVQQVKKHSVENLKTLSDIHEAKCRKRVKGRFYRLDNHYLNVTEHSDLISALEINIGDDIDLKIIDFIFQMRRSFEAHQLLRVVGLLSIKKIMEAYFSLEFDPAALVDVSYQGKQYRIKSSFVFSYNFINIIYYSGFYDNFKQHLDPKHVPSSTVVPSLSEEDLASLSNNIQKLNLHVFDALLKIREDGTMMAGCANYTTTKIIKLYNGKNKLVIFPAMESENYFEIIDHIDFLNENSSLINEIELIHTRDTREQSDLLFKFYMLYGRPGMKVTLSFSSHFSCSSPFSKEGLEHLKGLVSFLSTSGVYFSGLVLSGIGELDDATVEKIRNFQISTFGVSCWVPWRDEKVISQILTGPSVLSSKFEHYVGRLEYLDLVFKKINRISLKSITASFLPNEKYQFKYEESPLRSKKGKRKIDEIRTEEEAKYSNIAQRLILVNVPFLISDLDLSGTSIDLEGGYKKAYLSVAHRKDINSAIPKICFIEESVYIYEKPHECPSNIPCDSYY
ncbi:hypothetical protein ENBRE01_2396 [Enteropsectra breve]|nr:hypothetical protein ENBRE01_2396 [Enteropsectra breve]